MFRSASPCSEARGDYWRFLPHDDLSPPGTLERLIDTLDRDPEAILAYGPTRAIDLAGNHLPERDRLAPHGISMDAPWTLRVALDMFWEGYFDGAFKGLIRRSAICSPALPIRSTRDQILPERAWLFALCLKGRFRFVADATYVKRFYADSTHASWVIDDCHLLSASGVMMHYASEAIADSGIRHLAIEYLTQRLRERLGWSETASVTAERPAAEILHGLQPQGFRGGSHGFRSPSIGHEDAIRHMLNQSVPG